VRDVFEVRLSTRTYAPPHGVTLMTPANNWRQLPGQYVDGCWVFSLDETELGAQGSYFKFLLDGRVWMDGSYIRIAPAAGDSYNFDESEVSFAMSVTPVAPSSATAPAVVETAVTPSPAVAARPAVAAASPAPVSEGAALGRFVALLTPFFTVAASWLAGIVARNVPGVTLDKTQVVAFMIAVATVCLGSAWKWLQGWQQHELLVAQKLAAALKPVVGSALPPAAPAVTAGEGGTPR
jgi:hypothetical protein